MEIKLKERKGFSAAVSSGMLPSGVGFLLSFDVMHSPTGPRTEEWHVAIPKRGAFFLIFTHLLACAAMCEDPHALELCRRFGLDPSFVDYHDKESRQKFIGQVKQFMDQLCAVEQS